MWASRSLAALRNPSDLLTCSGAACFQNMEVRVLSRACHGKW
jgi:hypothetical protein